MKHIKNCTNYFVVVFQELGDLQKQMADNSIKHQTSLEEVLKELSGLQEQQSSDIEEHKLTLENLEQEKSDLSKQLEATNLLNQEQVTFWF